MQTEMKEFFNALAPDWDEKVPAVLPARSAAAFLCGVRPGSRVLDIACGTGVMEPELLGLGAGSIVGVDMADRMISKAREKFAGDERVSFVAGDIMALDGADFDAAVVYNAYPHFLDKKRLIEKIASLLRPGGRLTVAHGGGRDKINVHHKNEAADMSVPLRPAVEEAEDWKMFFRVDTLVDTPEIYVISGTLK